MEVISSSDPSSSSNPSFNPPWQEMFRSASIRKSNSTSEIQTTPAAEPTKSEPENSFSGDPQVRLALYIALAHAGLVLAISILYALYKLLEQYLRPLQWAVICSIPLRGIQQTLVGFWSEPLQLGLAETVLAFPLSIYRGFSDTLIEIPQLCFRIVLRRPKSADSRQNRSAFSKLLRWLVSFWILIIAYENVGSVGSLALILSCFIFSSKTVNSAIAALSSFRISSFPRTAISAFFTRKILKRLKTIVAIGLIAAMIIEFLVGALFFSYKIGVEGKDAVIFLKSHVEQSNYAEKIGLKKWVEENDIHGVVENYTAKFYSTMVEKIDNLAVQYNMTQLVAGIKHFVTSSPDITELVAGIQRFVTGSPVNSSPPASPEIIKSPYEEKIMSLRALASNKDWEDIHTEVNRIIKDLTSTSEDFVARVRAYSAQGLDLSQLAFSSSKSVVGGSTKVAVSIGNSIIAGASEFFNFLYHSFVFFWALYYLITSESGGVTEKMFHMVPIPASTRARCVQVLDNAVSGILLATAEVAIFQGCLTWLLFRLFKIHFLYLCTVLAFVSPLLPLLPAGLSTIPAAVELMMAGRYIQAGTLSILHLGLLSYGCSEIQGGRPAHSEYLISLSIIGGMTLFPSALEGAILGPLITTVVIALKDLYVEFVTERSNEEEERKEEEEVEALPGL